MQIEINLNYTIELDNCKIDTLTGCIKKLLKFVASDIICTVLYKFSEHYMKSKKKPFSCTCGNDRDFTWKTRNGRETLLKTIFADVKLNQYQVMCKNCGKRIYITRSLLGIDRYKKMSALTEKMLALIGSLCSFRVAEKILSFVGVSLNRMDVWRSVQNAGKDIEFGIDPEESTIFEADGTGIPIKGIKKRGLELKVFIQRKLKGGIRIAALTIDKYDHGWDKLFAPLIKDIKNLKNFHLVTDGDTNILKGLKNVKVSFQRCLWHIPHQVKYCMWKDKINRKSVDYYYIFGRLLDICTVKKVNGTDDELKAFIEAKQGHLEKLIEHCTNKNFESTKAYLQNAAPDLFNALEKKSEGKTTSFAERVMRTANMRTNIAKWSPDGALNALKVRLAYYYNGFDADFKKESKMIKILKT